MNEMYPLVWRPLDIIVFSVHESAVYIECLSRELFALSQHVGISRRGFTYYHAMSLFSYSIVLIFALHLILYYQHSLLQAQWSASFFGATQRHTSTNRNSVDS